MSIHAFSVIEGGIFLALLRKKVYIVKRGKKHSDVEKTKTPGQKEKVD